LTEPPPVSPDELLLFHKEDDYYDELRARFNKRVDKHPAVIALCRDTEEVSKAVRYAKQEGLKISVKSGGHSFECFSSNDGGLVIDLSLINQIEWIDDETIRVGPGCKLSELYDALLPQGRILPAGACGGVGVGGLTLGGGYGLFSREFGLTCDSMNALTFVDGVGTVHESRDKPELLWACRGGGNGNFGVVTEMIFKTSPAPSGIYRSRFKAKRLNPERAAELMETWFEVAAELPPTAFSAFVLNGTSLLILVTDTKERDAETDALLAKLTAVTDTASLGRREELSKALPKHYGRKGPLYFKNASAGLYTSFDDIRSVAQEVASLVAGGGGLIYQINTLGGKIADSAFARDSAFPHRQRPFLAELQTYYERARDEASRLTAFRKVQSSLREAGVIHHYRNYPDLDFEDWEVAYYGASYPRLQELKARYDPEDLFHHPQSVRPK
jgi:FAD/FMN-containing dehydrogenase